MGKAKSTLKLYCNALGRLRHSKGFGIHSPFAFSFVLRVLREKCAYYAYSDIEERRRLAIRLVAEEEGEHPRIISQKNAKMLFRIACYFNPSNMVQIGTSYGVSTTAVLEREGVIVARNLLVSDLVVGFVREVTSELDYGMTFTNGRIVVIVGYKHLPRQRFNLWF